MEKQIKQSQNFVQVVGTLAEMNFEVVEKETTLKNFKAGKEKKVTCKVVAKKDFKNPSLLVEVSPVDEEGNVRYTAMVGVNMSEVAEFSLDEDGKQQENSAWKEMMTIMSDYIPKKDAKEGEVPTRVMVKSARLQPNEYVDKKTFDYKVYLPNISTYHVTSNGVPEYDIAEGNISGIIRAITPELKGGDSEEETGRLKVELYTFNSTGKASPVNLIAEQDIAEDLNDAYQAGDSVKLYYEVLTKQIGGAPKKTTSAFGRRESNTVSGFSITEYSIFNGDEKFEEEHELYISIEDMKEAMKERQILIETKIKEAKEKGKEDKKDKPSTGTSRGGLGGRTTKATEPKEEQSVGELF